MKKNGKALARTAAHIVRRRWLSVTLWLLFAASLVTMLKASPNRLFNGEPLATIFAPFGTANQIAFDLAVGVIASLLMYVLVIWLPARDKRRRIRGNLAQEYDRFKEDCIYQLLFAAGTPAETEVAESLKDFREFRAFFKANGPKGRERWYDVMNGLEPQHIQSILIALGVLAEEVRFTLASVDVADEEIFSFLKRLTRAIVHFREMPADQDVKYLTNFLWEILAGWSVVSGYHEEDFVTKRLARI